MRIGAKKRPFYRVVAVDERSKRTGAYVELLGTYNPLTKPKEIKLKQDRIDYWMKQGAQPSDGFLRIIGKAKQRPARKPKKEKKEEPAPAPVEEKPAENNQTEEIQAESTSAEGDGEEVSSGEAAANTVSEDAPEETEPAGPTSDQTEKGEDEGTA